MFDPSFQIDRARGAEYNPREIDADGEARLDASIRAIGFCKPILVSPDGTIIAGHQRTNAARRLGLETVPAYVIAKIALGDEMRFNQLHNGADMDLTDSGVRVPPSESLGFAEVSPDDIACRFDLPGAPMRNEIYRLITTYGPWGCAVAIQSGEVVSSHQYAVTSKIASVPLRVFYLPNALRDEAVRLLSGQYGEFSYEKLPSNPWVQARAQPGRMSDQWLYRERVLPELQPGERLLDFGCGQGRSVADLQKNGVNAHGIELFYMGSSDTIKPEAARRRIDSAMRDIQRNGRFDVVVCDVVLNSVASRQAERDVCAVINALCRPGGRIYFSGRPMEHGDTHRSKARAHCIKAMTRRIEFVDRHGFTAMARGGLWFFQKFHTRDKALDLGKAYIGPEAQLTYDNDRWVASGIKTIELDQAEAEAALLREFDMPWPEGHTVDRGAAVVSAYRAALALG